MATARCTIGFNLLAACPVVMCHHQLVELKNSIAAIIVISLLLFIFSVLLFACVLFSVHCFSFAHVYKNIKNNQGISNKNIVTPGFQNKIECISYVRQDQVYTHMIHIISEYIKRQCSKHKQERVHNFITLQ